MFVHAFFRATAAAAVGKNTITNLFSSGMTENRVRASIYTVYIGTRPKYKSPESALPPMWRSTAVLGTCVIAIIFQNL